MIWPQNLDGSSSIYIQWRNNCSLAKWIWGTPPCSRLSRKSAILEAQNEGKLQKKRQCSVVATSRHRPQLGTSTSPNFQSLFLDHKVLLINSTWKLFRLRGIFSFNIRLKLLLEISKSNVSTPSLSLVRSPGGGSWCCSIRSVLNAFEKKCLSLKTEW